MPPAEPEASLTRKAAILVVSRAMTIMTVMISLIILTRVLSKDDFALLSFLLLVYATTLTLSRLGLPDSVFYYLERISEASHKGFVILTARNMFLVGLPVCTLLIPLHFLAPIWGFQVNHLLFPLAAIILIELPTFVLPNTLIALGKVTHAALLNIVSGVLQFTALVVPASLGQPIEHVVYALLLYSVSKFAIFTGVFLRTFSGPVGTLASELVKEQFAYSIPLGISQVLWDINRQIDKYIIAAVLPVTIYAEYVVGAWEIPLLPAIAYTVSLAMMPNLVRCVANGDQSALLDLWHRAIKKVSVLVLPLAVMFLVVAEEIIILLFTADYAAAAIPFRIYTMSVLLRVGAYTSVLKALGETTVIYRSAAYLLFINLALGIPLALWLGMSGPPLATLIANIAMWGYALTNISRLLHVDIGRVFPFAFYLKSLSVAFVAAIPALLVQETLVLQHTALLAVVMITYLTSYVGIARITGLVEPGHWQTLLRSTMGKSDIADEPHNPIR